VRAWKEVFLVYLLMLPFQLLLQHLSQHLLQYFLQHLLLSALEVPRLAQTFQL
jgi:hypothetical protein